MTRWLLVALLCTLGAATWLAILPALVMPAELRARDIVVTVVAVVVAAVVIARRSL